ncbi:hypothetical protein CORT_0C05520 [Candida orthopsilosis Co 90-125]|uniref:Cytochrome b5 heme-binding domain-containing protein n=1 Tax=Candida orthopsilosis (strain 90-125) TaxID=1136231 RepID=H8X366_CANO9|nr:hypothetical protein CORT_0C05520 [Candida orthopsilosis Co 90-125]CCG25926.1 hypothetical protein CORT_0C05520 [Candida orthopsilosis Co 90-125]
MSRSSRRDYSLLEIKKHDQPTDLWMVLYNKVYDVTDFCKYHLGGIEVLYDCGGSDATQAFEDVGHSDFAVEMLQPYLIGQVLQDEQREYHKLPKNSVDSDVIESIKFDELQSENLNEYVIRRVKESTNMMVLTFVALSSFILLVLIHFQR